MNVPSRSQGTHETGTVEAGATLANHVRRVTEADAPMLLLLPKGCVWTYHDVQPDSDTLNRWYEHDCIRRVDRGTQHRNATFRVRDAVYERAEEEVGEGVRYGGRLPCGCSGFTSVSDGIECRWHERQYDTDVAKAHLS